MVLRFCFEVKWLWLGAMLIAVGSTNFFRSQGWETSRLCVKTPFLFGSVFPTGPGIWAISGAAWCCQPAGRALPPLLCPLNLFHKLPLDNNKNAIVHLLSVLAKTPKTPNRNQPKALKLLTFSFTTFFGEWGDGGGEVVLFLFGNLASSSSPPREVMLTVGVLEN